MAATRSLLRQIQARVRTRDYHFTLHAEDRIIQRYISVREVEDALLSKEAEVIEDYPEDPRGSSCLILGFTLDGRPLHIQSTYPPDISIITAYEPESEGWIDWRVRKGGEP